MEHTVQTLIDDATLEKIIKEATAFEESTLNQVVVGAIENDQPGPLATAIAFSRVSTRIVASLALANGASFEQFCTQAHSLVGMSCSLHEAQYNTLLAGVIGANQTAEVADTNAVEVEAA